VQALGANIVVHDTLIVKSFDGTDSRTLDVTITGTNDGPVAVADAAPEPRTRR
jgi:VCBS repeat-containing protein